LGPNLGRTQASIKLAWSELKMAMCHRRNSVKYVVQVAESASELSNIQGWEHVPGKSRSVAFTTEFWIHQFASNA